MLDLESLYFDQGGLLMANKKCDLPSGSYRTHDKGYEEVHVPAVSKKVDVSEKLVKIAEMPDWAQPAFKGMQQLNRVQSKVYETALFKADNILLCAPTGAGKTTLQENIVILTDILTENEILGIFRRISSEYTDEIPRKSYSSENTDEYPRIYYSR
uniref:DEAD/DEAH box helicase domain-containing protein n=1 Tax=Brassica oleracea var. oleracea TaxID=109376 RepID=A0A0D3BL10_BRAOL